MLFTRTFDLLEWLLPKAEKFPRQFRATVVQRLMDAVLDFNEAIHDAHRQGGSTRERHLRQADAHLDTLRVYLRLAPPLALAVHQPVRACERDGGRDRPPAGWLDEGQGSQTRSDRQRVRRLRS